MNDIQAAIQTTSDPGHEDAAKDRGSTACVSQQTLDYLKDRYYEEQARFSHLESKCEKFMLFTTAIITVAIALASKITDLILSSESMIGHINAAVFLIGSLSIACSWGHALSALRIQDSSVLPKSRRTAEYLRDSDQESASLHIYNCYVDTLERLRETLIYSAVPAQLHVRL